MYKVTKVIVTVFLDGAAPNMKCYPMIELNCVEHHRPGESHRVEEIDQQQFYQHQKLHVSSSFSNRASNLPLALEAS